MIFFNVWSNLWIVGLGQNDANYYQLVMAILNALIGHFQNLYLLVSENKSTDSTTGEIASYM
jgi:hypothetical protein